MEEPVQPAWLTKPQAAQYLQVSEKTLERGMQAGTLRFIGGGKGIRIRFRTEWLDDWYTQRGRGSG